MEFFYVVHQTAPPLNGELHPLNGFLSKLESFAKTKSRSQGLLFALAKINKGIRTRREQTCRRKKTVRWTVFADVVKERSDAKAHGSAPKKSLALRHKAHRNFDRITMGFFYARKPLNIRVIGRYFLVFLHSRQHI